RDRPILLQRSESLEPAALAGVDVAEMLRRARAMMALCRKEGEENPGLRLGAAIGAAAVEGRDKLTFFVGPPAPRFGMWIEQLIAESTGKEGRGILPVEGEPPGAPEVYGSDRFFVGIARKGDSAWPVRTDERFVMQDPLDLGAEMFRWEFATAVAGKILGINPFDQPNVQEAKDRTNEILKGQSTVDSRDKSTVGSRQSTVDAAAVRKLLGSMKAGDYFAITAYLRDTPETEESLKRIRVRVRDAKKVATTVGFGPRFLHSTGQLHKGGPDTGVFLQVTADPAAAVPIPGKPYGFEEVVAAQAAGDLAALRSRGRRTLRVHLKEEVAAGLRELEAAVAGALA
ncbi:MAG TPA: hypothetical protein VKH43_02255, partial [Thermoanaerobaculia bacterium]|nr:hypothetical protein [Thermoanaerobaculia bacterium]